MKKILVANRGEIALRVMRTAKKMGIQTVAIYSEADRDTPHVYFADEAVCVGPPPSNESYLNQKKIIQICKDLNVDGIHPGYGFLSENAKFAKAVTKAGIKFIGPSPHSIKIMGSKLDAKKAVKKYNIPMVPGINEAITDIKAAKKIATDIGYPILIKASAGGGGKGMRIVENEGEFVEQMNRAVSEATSAFGDGSVFIEKYVSSPRHIEIQVLADSHGNCVHLFERECSIQRRHQKVIEEAPSAVLDEILRNDMGEAAINVAKSCKYEGAGTVEFLLDENKNFYFLEMNTRLQVEHPVTEMISGVDLVEQQILVARGKKLAFTQEDLLIHGHAIELRVYAEDPTNNFLPSIGKLTEYSIPLGENIRVDDAYEKGMTIPIHYDPMIAKLAVHAETRKEAILLMKKAISNYRIEGIMTTLDFGYFAMNHKAFVSGNFNTHFIGKYYKPNKKKRQNKLETEMIAKIAAELYNEASNKTNVPNVHNDEWHSNRS